MSSSSPRNVMMTWSEFVMAVSSLRCDLATGANFQLLAPAAVSPASGVRPTTIGPQAQCNCRPTRSAGKMIFGRWPRTLCCEQRR